MTPQLRDAVICEPLRTPVGGYGGVFRDVTAAALAATVVRAVLARTGVPAEAVDDVILGQCYPNGEAPAIGRVAALDAGLPVEVPGLQVDRRCGSGLQAVINAAMQVQTGASDLVLAGGVESMSQAEFYTTGARWGVRGAGTMLHDRLARGRVTSGGANYPVAGGMLETAENLRREYAIPREEQDRLALRSHEKAVAAQRAGRFDDEIVPVTVTTRKGESVIDTDEHPGPTPPWRSCPPCVPSSAARTPTPRSRRAMPAARTTARRSASSPTRPARPSWACGRWPALSPGPWWGYRRARWASARCRPPPARWTGPG